MTSDRTTNTFRHLVLLLAIALTYFVAARLGLSLAFDTRQVTAVWPPTGIALAMVLIFGSRVWPGILLGAFVVNVGMAEPVGTALGIGIGNTLEALAGAWLLRRVVNFGRDFRRAREAFGFIALAALVAPVVSAVIGTTSLCLGGVVPWSSFGRVAMVWWTGDALGALVVAPLILSWSARPLPRRWWSIAEAAGLMACLTIVCLIGFGSTTEAKLAGYPFKYTVFPFVIWAAYRFGMRGATMTTFFISLIAILGAVGGELPIGAGALNDRLIMLQLFLAVVAMTGLVFGAMSADRNRAQSDLRRAYDQMEAQVEVRTADLARTNRALTAVIEGHRHTLDQLRIRERQFAEAQALAQIGSWEWDMETDTVTWSDELFRLYGLEPQSVRVEYEKFLERVPLEDRELIRSNVSRAISEGTEFAHSHRVVWPDGSIHWVHGQGRVIRNAAGRAIAMSGTAQDISSRKEHEDALQRAHDELESRVDERTEALRRANQTKDEFLATLAHELRNPLAPIRYAVDAMRYHEHIVPEFARQLEIVDRQVMNIVRLLNELLDISRVERGKIDLQLRTVDLSESARRAVETCAPLIREHKHDLRMVFPGDPLPVTGDPLRLEQVIVNLLTNAAKYTPDGGEIRLSVEQAGETAILRVKDTGVGIEPDFLGHVFELFVQAKQGLNRASGGLGIGLTLVRKLVEMHGGTVAAASEGPGKGSEFVVTLPLATADGSLAPAVTEVPALANPVAVASRRVLVIEDHHESRGTLRELLSMAGYEALVAPDGPEGLKLAQEFRPEIVLIDIGLPGMSGYEVCEALVRDLRGEARLIALTGYGDPASRSRATAAGFHLVLSKPIAFADLKRVLVDVVEVGSSGQS